MNEETTTPEAAEGEQLETTTSDEVLQIMGKTAPETTEGEDSEEEVTETTETSEETEEDTTEEETDTPESPEKPESHNTEEETVTEAPTFSVEIEDANGKKFTVSPEDNLEDVLAEFEPKNNGQVLQLMRDLDHLSGEKSAYESQQAEAATEAERQEIIANLHSGWDSEIQKLQGEKRLPLDAKIDDRKNEVFKFMADENDKRRADGRPLLQSFEDALDKLELREEKEAKSKALRDEKEANKKRGGLVGGSSAPATSGSPTYRTGTARNASEAIKAMGLL